jgi:hypothetical protein
MKHIYYIFLLTVCFVISGCAGIQYSDKVQAVDIAQMDKKEATTKVLAIAEEWRNSGVIVKEGFTYKIAATGRWTAGPICGWTSPDGFGASPICGGSAGTYIGRGSASLLIGKIGEQGTPFDVGNKLELTAEEEGILFFRINDTPMWMGDNDGFANVKTALVPPVAEKTVQYPQEKPSLSDDKLPPIRPDTYAIVIGIDYKGRHDIPNLQYPSQDAKKVYDILTDPKYGGVPKENSILLLNEKATRNEMISALRKTKNWDGYVYVYYSGHGAPKAIEDKFVDAYLVPYDVVITDPEAMEDTSIKISYLNDLVDASQAKGVMVALDACFTGGGKSIVPKGGKPLVLMGVSPELIKPKGMGKVVITSSAANQQSWEDETEIKGGIFSYFLLEGLKGKAGKDVWVKVDELANYIKENVPRTARKLKGAEQNPQVSGKADFAVTRNWEKAKVMDIEIARGKLKSAFEKGHITAEQLSKAMDELKTQKRTKTLEAFLEGKIDEKKFGELY